MPTDSYKRRRPSDFRPCISRSSPLRTVRMLTPSGHAGKGVASSSERLPAKSAAITSASLAPETRRPSADKLIERVGERDEVGLLTRRRRLERLGEPIDPHGRDAERRSRNDVVEVRRGDMHVRQATDTFLECTPVAERRLVRADLPRDDRELERNADARHRRLDEVAVGVRQDRELPASRSRGVEGLTRLRKNRPLRKRPRELVGVVEAE